MPANLKELRGKIRNVKSTQQITKAMKLVSAAKFGRAQQAVVQSRPYFTGMKELVGRLCGQGQVSQHQLVSPNGSPAVLLFVISSQRGLCGGYNANVTKQALAQVEKLKADGREVSVVCLGRKAFQLLGSRLPKVGFKGAQSKHISAEEFSKNGLDAEVIRGNLTLVDLSFEKPNVTLSNQLGMAFRELFFDAQFGEVQVVFSRFGSAISQTPTVETVLPMKPETASESREEPAMGEALYEPDLLSLVSVALPRFLNVQILQILKESMASEFGARMTAMDNATRNAKDMERRYQIQYQRARQAAITTELVEIISGAEAL